MQADNNSSNSTHLMKPRFYAAKSAKVVRGKTMGKTNTKRRLPKNKETILGITKPALRRIARRGGVKRIGTEIYQETRVVLKDFLTELIRDTLVYTEHARRKTVTALDVAYALKHQGRPIYGVNM